MQCRQKYNWRKMALKNNFEPLLFHSWYILCCCCSVIKSSLTLSTPWTAAGQALHPTLSPRVHSNSCPLSRWYSLIISFSATPFSLPSIFLSIMAFYNELIYHIRWPKYWSFNISLANEYPRLIFIRIDWFDLFTVQGALKRHLEHHDLEASILWHSAFFMVQLSHLYRTTRKTTALII